MPPVRPVRAAGIASGIGGGGGGGGRFSSGGSSLSFCLCLSVSLPLPKKGFVRKMAYGYVLTAKNLLRTKIAHDGPDNC